MNFLQQAQQAPLRSRLVLASLAGAALALGLAGGARAACSRVLEVPVAPIGMGVTVDGGEVGGIYPDLLRHVLESEGCRAHFIVVPRARQEKMFESGLADVLLPARRSPRRDALGLFVPLIQSRAALVTLEPPAHAAGVRGHSISGVRSLADLRQRDDLRLAVVRGYDYGEDYQQLLSVLAARGRLQQAVDPISLMRLLDAGVADVAIIAPTIASGALLGDARLKAWLPRLHVDTLDELGWGESGVYLSRRSRLSDADRERLGEALQQMARSGAAWRSFQRHYPEEMLKDTVRPR